MTFSLSFGQVLFLYAEEARILNGRAIGEVSKRFQSDFFVGFANHGLWHLFTTNRDKPFASGRPLHNSGFRRALKRPMHIILTWPSFASMSVPRFFFPLPTEKLLPYCLKVMLS